MPGDQVYARNYAQGEKWVLGRIDQRTGPVSFTVELEDHRMTRRHQDQIFRREINHVDERDRPARARSPSNDDSTEQQPAADPDRCLGTSQIVPKSNLN